MRILLLLSALFVCFQASAQPQTTKVFVTPKTPSTLNQRLAYEVRELIRESSRLSSADGNGEALIQVSISTLESPPGDTIVFSAILTVGGAVKASGMYLQ